MSDSRIMPAEAGEPRWREPAIEPPPRGRKLLLLTSGGIACIGDWMDDSNLTHWSPLPKRPSLSEPANCSADQTVSKPWVKSYCGGKPNYTVPIERHLSADDETTEPHSQFANSEEPVAWQWLDSGHFRKRLPNGADANAWRPLYTTLLARQPLTADETMALANASAGDHWCDEAHLQRFRAAIEKAHGIGGDA